MDRITETDIRAIVTHSAYLAAKDYVRQRRVISVETRPDGAIAAMVLGGGNNSYQQTITIRHTPNFRVLISGDCTCPVGQNCKHVAAALIVWRGGQTSLPLPSAPPPPPPLPHDVGLWLNRVAEAAKRVDDSEDYPAAVTRRLFYILSPRPISSTYPLQSPLTLDLRSVELRRDGSLSGRATAQDAGNLLRMAQVPAFLRPSDRTILLRLSGLGGPGSEAFIETFRSILATGRARWIEHDSPPLALAGPVDATIVWRPGDDGNQAAALDLPPGCVALRFATPWYLDPATGQTGEVRTALPARIASAVLSAPPLAPAAVAQVRAELTRRLPASGIPAPVEQAPPRTIKVPAIPRLDLVAAHLRTAPQDGWRYGRRAAPPELRAVPAARLQFQYGPVTLPAQDRNMAGSTTMRHDGELLTIETDRTGERKAWTLLHGNGLGALRHVVHVPDTHPNANDLVMDDPADFSEWIDFLFHEVPALRNIGWQVEIAGDFPIRIAEPDGPIAAEIRQGSGIDWFDLDLGVFVDGERIDLVPTLLHLISTGGAQATETDDDEDVPIMVVLDSAEGAGVRILALPAARIRPILAPLLELFAGAAPGAEGGIRISRFDAATLAAMEEASAATGASWSGGEAVRTLGRQLRDAGGIPRIQVPDSFKATLRPYQAHGVDWMAFLNQAGLGGVLADDMGLGKTVQALAHLTVEQQAGRLDRPSLLICPTSLVPNWLTEAARFAPTLRVLVLHGPGRAGQFDLIPGHDLVVTTYPLLARDHATLIAQPWRLVILDEAQTIKNPAATTSKLARSLQAGQRLCLSGTPLENHLGELWSLFDFVMPGFLGDQKSFATRYRTPIEKQGDGERQSQLARRVAPFLLRRTKAEVAADLPPKTDIAEIVQMAPPQQAVYEAIRLAMHAKVQQAIASRGLARSGIVILDALLKLRQVCCDPRLVKLDTAKAAKARSAKLDRLMELLPSMLEDGRRILLFSQFTSMLALIQEELAGLGIPHVLLTGDTKDRRTPVAQFQGGEIPLFLISLKAGGVGLNLTAADTVIHYDPWWNPAVENQATDRAHRIGQDKPVFVHRLITAGTIEEKMEILKARKQALVDGILDANAGATLKITEADLEALLG